MNGLLARCALPLSAALLLPAAPAQNPEALTLEQTVRGSGAPSFSPPRTTVRFGPERKLVQVAASKGEARVVRWIDTTTMEVVDAPAGAGSAPPAPPEGRRGGRAEVAD